MSETKVEYEMKKIRIRLDARSQCVMGYIPPFAHAEELAGMEEEGLKNLVKDVVRVWKFCRVMREQILIAQKRDPEMFTALFGAGIVVDDVLVEDMKL